MRSFSLQRLIALSAAGLGPVFFVGSVHAAALVLHSSMDDADIDGTTVKDLAAPAEDGTLQTNVATGAVGQIGQAIDAATTGSAASVSYGNVLNPGTNDMTVMLWFNADSVKSQFLVRKGNATSSNEGWSLQVESRNAGEHLRIFGRANATGLATNNDRALLLLDLSPEASIGQWHHVAMVINSVGSIELYVNGSSAGVTSNDWGANFNTDANGIAPGASLLLGVGAGGGTDMKLDDFAIFDGTLTAQEVSTIYQNGLNGIAVPEPASLGLLACGGLMLITRRRND